MKQTNEPLICPYTGLRSFTEDESLYFKGRDEQIDQVAGLLEKNKFLMLTGASGEGKSSLIYAGLIPNARAGFFKSKYTNWIVTDFRPERTPVKNMASAVAATFSISSSTVETELARGYSSLIDLYVNSSFYTDENDAAWKTLSDAEKKNKTRGAANLLIIVDQFEEFFTNPENYFKEAPSQESQIVVNLALETARIALQRNLPVYVVCTMRSDYIGQCSAFRGLPEYIGFSQFFVPRLKRQEVKQVIEEPALLSGNRITRRLVERLVYDLSEGIDQLPILQHALRQVWLAAEHGNEEMDLIHYAMVGGMPADDLPESDQPRYADWFTKLPEHQKKFYDHPELNKVIEIHANRLYEGAWINYNETHPEKLISQKDAKRIIAMTFSCLTKIDDSRAVRNRMTLREITNIINHSHLTVDVVGGVLDVFRESNNSFIRPYTTEGSGTHLSPDTILDITHESLIRNWALLNKWASQEFEYYSTFLDFKKQLGHWKSNNKSNGFLLPLGPLTYFEEWYAKCKPNTWWIDRYSEIRNDHALSLQQSETTLADTKEYLKRSARKVVLTRTFMKYGARRIATVFALSAMILLTGFYGYDAEQKTNRSIEAKVVTKSRRLLESKEISSINKATYLIIEERLTKGSLVTYLNEVANKKDQLDLTLASYRLLLYYDKFTELPLKTQLITMLVDQLKNYTGAITDRDRSTFLLERQNQFLFLLAYDEYFNPSTTLANEIIPALTNSQYQHALYFFSNPAPFKLTIPAEINAGLQLWLTFGNPTKEAVRSLIAKVSPFGDSTARRVFDRYYAKGSLEGNGRLSSDYGGGHHMLASLYSAAGDSEQIIRCFELLPETYFRTTLFNNYTNIVGLLYQYEHIGEAKRVMQWMADRYPTDDPLTVFRNMVIRSAGISGIYGINLEKNFLRSNSGYLHLNLSFAKRPQFFKLAEEYERVANEVKDPNERNFLLAMHYKRVAVLYHKYLTERGLSVNQKQLDELLDKAWDHYGKISEEHLNTTQSLTYRYYSDGVRTRQHTRRVIFLYPDYRDGWFASKFNTDLFLDHCLRRDLLSKYYNTPQTLDLVHEWISSAFELPPAKKVGDETASYLFHRFAITDKMLTDILEFVDRSPAGKNFDRNLPLLILTNRNFEKGNVNEAMSLFNQLDKGSLKASEDKYEYLSTAYFANSIVDLVGHLAAQGHLKEAMDLTTIYKGTAVEFSQKTYCFTEAASSLYKTYQPETFMFLDSAYQNANRVNYNLEIFDVRPALIYMLGKVGGEQVNKFSRALIRDLFEEQRAESISYLILGTATDGNYYTAIQAMPATLTEDQELSCYSAILLQVARSQKVEPGWEGMDDLIFGPLDYYGFGI